MCSGHRLRLRPPAKARLAKKWSLTLQQPRRFAGPKRTAPLSCNSEFESNVASSETVNKNTDLKGKFQLVQMEVQITTNGETSAISAAKVDEFNVQVSCNGLSEKHLL